VGDEKGVKSLNIDTVWQNVRNSMFPCVFVLHFFPSLSFFTPSLALLLFMVVAMATDPFCLKWPCL